MQPGGRPGSSCPLRGRTQPSRPGKSLFGLNKLHGLQKWSLPGSAIFRSWNSHLDSLSSVSTRAPAPFDLREEGWGNEAERR